MTKERTTRMNYLVDEYPNIDFHDGKVTLYKRHSRDNEKPEIIFDLPVQQVEYLREGILVIRVSETVKEIFSITREDAICSIPAPAQVQIITENRKLKGYLVTTFVDQVVYNKMGKFVCSAKNDEAILQPTELLGSRVVFIKKMKKDGTKTYISFDKEEIEVKPTDIVTFLTFDGQTIFSIERENKVIWLNEHFHKVGEYDSKYTVVDCVNRIQNSFGKRLPDWMNVQREWKEDKVTKENYPHYTLGDIQWERHDSILLDEERNIFEVVKANAGHVECYAYSKQGEEVVTTSIGTFKINSEVPVLELKG